VSLPLTPSQTRSRHTGFPGKAPRTPRRSRPLDWRVECREVCSVERVRVTELREGWRGTRTSRVCTKERDGPSAQCLAGHTCGTHMDMQMYMLHACAAPMQGDAPASAHGPLPSRLRRDWHGTVLDPCMCMCMCMCATAVIGQPQRWVQLRLRRGPPRRKPA